MYKFLVLILSVVFSSCTTTPPTADQIHETAAQLLGAIDAPAAPDMKIHWEPTNIRWTIARGQEETLTTDSEGRMKTTNSNAPDSLLGISFGSGVFLDSKGNLSVLPLELWPDHWPRGTKFKASVTPTLWNKNTIKTPQVERLAKGWRVYQEGLFGKSTQDYDPDSTVIIAFNKKATRNKDGSWWETNATQLLEKVHSYAVTETGIKHTVHHIVEASILYEREAGIVHSSDNSLSIEAKDDHWVVRLGTMEWWIFWGSSKVVVYNVRLGGYAVLSQEPEGATLKSSSGNTESITALQ